MYSIVYISRAAEGVTSADLGQILASSRRRNPDLGVTGLLVWCCDHFLQVLEGPEDVVNDLFERISADERHEGVRQVGGKQIDERNFPDWSMGFEDVETMTLIEHLLAPLVDHELIPADVVAAAKIERFLVNR